MLVQDLDDLPDFTLGVLGVLVFTLTGDVGLASEWPYLFTGWHSIGLWVLALIATCSLLNLTAIF